MKFTHPKDSKAFVIGLLASFTAVILWDIIKSKTKILDYKQTKNYE